MNNNKIAVVLDGNYWFHKTFGVFAGFGNKNPGKVLAGEAEINMFMQKVITDVCYTINQIPDIEKIVFCKDSRSWRKDYKISRSVYKGNREDKDIIDWGSFFKLLDEFGEYVESNGFIFSRIHGAEGDDLMWSWAKELRKDGYSVMILTGDKDINQMVDFDETGWTCIWNGNSKNNKITTAEEFILIEPIVELSIFDVTPTSDGGNSKFKKLLESAKIDKVNVKEFVFRKILEGDDGDNVPCVFPFNNKSGNPSGIKEGRSKKIWYEYLKSAWKDQDLEILWKDQDFLGWLAGLTLRIISQTDNKENRDKFKQYYEENAILMWLNGNTIPEKVIEDMEDHIGLSQARQKGKIITDRKILIEKSPWSTTNAAPKVFDPFSLFL